MNQNEPSEEREQKPQSGVPLPLKILGALCALGGISSLVDLVPILFSLFDSAQTEGTKIATLVIYGVLIVLLIASAALFVVLGYRLIKDRRAHAAHAAQALAVLTILSIIATMMLFGLSAHHIGYLIQLIVLIALTTYLDPSLAEERALQRKLKKMNKEQQKEEKKKIEAAKPKKGLITLNFFNLFWIFVVCCILGLIIETVFHFVVFHEYQDRAGMLFGPFSPIYGFGALLMTIALNRFYRAPVWVIFLVSAVIGGAFEFFTSWIMEFAFGIVAWD
ncbi:MAG: putative ABC transporter permease, partial [Raoultibacter sp.]